MQLILNCRTKRVVSAIFVIVMLTVLSPRTDAQNITHAILDDHQWYLWTDDFPGLLESVLEEGNIDRGQLPTICAVALATVFPATDDIDNQALRQQTSELLSLIQGELLGSSVMAGFDVHLNTENRYRYRLERNVTLVVPTDRTEAETIELFDRCRELLVGIQATRRSTQEENAKPTARAADKQTVGESRKEEAEEEALEFVHTLGEGLGYWAIREDWLYWSSSQRSLIKEIENRSTPEPKSLGTHRTFQVFNRNVPSQPHAINVFVHNEAMPLFAMYHWPGLFGHSFSSAGIREIWNVAHLNALRGFGGRLTLQPSSDDAVIGAWDSLLIMGAPQAGILTALQHRHGIDYTMKLPDARLDRFTQIQIDSETYVEEVNALRDRVANELSKNDQSRYDDIQVLTWQDGYGMAREHWNQLFSSMSGMAQIRTGEWNSDQVSFGSEMIRMEADRQSIRSLAERLFEAEASQGGPKANGAVYALIRDDDLMTWKVSASVLAETATTIEAGREGFHKIELQKLEPTKGDPNAVEPTQEQIDAAIARADARFDKVKAYWMDVWTNESQVVADDWLWLYPVPDEQLVSGLDRHPQLAELQQRVKSLRSERRLPPPVGVSAVWGPRLAAVETVKHEDESKNSEQAASASTYVPSATDRASALVGQSVAPGRDLVLILTRDRRGLRLTGRLYRSQPVSDDDSR